MAREMFGVCKHPECGAEIYWLKTKIGGHVPLDPEPVPNGSIVIDDDGTARYIRKDEQKTLDRAAAIGMKVPKRYVSHFATCPFAKEFRR